MATMPPSPFTALPASSAETLVVAPRSQAPVAAASGPFPSVAIVERPAEAPAVASASQALSDAAAECCIGEIFVGARKLFDPDPHAYPREDELLYEVLKAMDNPHERDLPEIPAALWAEFEPLPLFLRQA